MEFPLQIFYDGSCMVCSAEMAKYRAYDHEGKLIFINIKAADFCAEDYGKTQADFMARLHVRDAAGIFYTGVDAFMAIWQAYPDCSVYRLLSAAVGFPGINLLSRGAYSLFARYRHLLPKANDDCRDGSCDLRH